MTFKNKSYSPSINNKLYVKSLRSFSKNKEFTNIGLCDDLKSIKIDKKCVNFFDKKLQKILLNRLKYSKKIDASKIIPPKQIYGNCWFNTMFMTFFISDKGNKFFRFFRELMITGKKLNNQHIEDDELKNMFFLLNIFIEASLNQTKNAKTKNAKTKNAKTKVNNKTRKYKKYNNELLEIFNKYTHNLQTNYFIKLIHDKIESKTLITSAIPNIDEGGNPIEFYKSLMNFLNYDILKILQITIKDAYIENIEHHISMHIYNKIPDIIILEDINNYNKTYKYKESYSINYNNKVINYSLDSIIITNKDYYKMNSSKHFVCVLTINNKGYKFDGYSYSRLTKFNWKANINKNKDWSFLENQNYHKDKYNFTKGYKLMFYYRT